jgi:hypothetical protein
MSSTYFETANYAEQGKLSSIADRLVNRSKEGGVSLLRCVQEERGRQGELMSFFFCWAGS